MGRGELWVSVQYAQNVFRVGADAVVGVGFGEEDFVVLRDDEGRRQREAPGVLALIAVDEGDVDKDAAVVGADVVGHRVGHAELSGQCGAGVGEDGIGEIVVLDGEVVLTDKLRADGDEQRTPGAGIIFPVFPHFFIELLPCFELGHTVGAPAAAEEFDDDGRDGEEVFGADGLLGDGVLQREGWSGGADREDTVFDAGGKELLDGGVGDGEALWLDELAGLRGDVVKLGLESA
jgi:hypothetical protein